MLRNEKYAGDVIYQKTLSTDLISKRTVINRGQKEKYLVSNNHPAIIDRDTFTLVQTPFNGNFAFVQIRAISTRKKHLWKQVLFSVIFALRRVILPFGQWYYASHSDIALRQFKANITSLWAKRTIPLLRQGKISRRARLGISHLFTTASVIAAKWWSPFYKCPGE